MKPREYCNVLTVMQETTYAIVEKNGDVTGIPRVAPLGVGRVVYLPNEEQVRQLPQDRVVAWAEGLGTIAIHRNSIARR